MYRCRMSNDLLIQGIRNFEKDANELKSIIRSKISEIKNI
jgi:transaldolase